jgi:choice-of-anchor B domain-containing protein
MKTPLTMLPSSNQANPGKRPTAGTTAKLVLALALCAGGLAACGGGSGGSGSSVPAVVVPPPPVTSDFGATLVSKVARNGVAGTWGYTAPDGSQYAIMGTAKGVLVLDVRDPANPRVVDELDGPTNTRSPGIYWREMRVYRHFAYVVSEHTNVRGGIMIIDLSGLPNSVRYVKSVAPRSGDLAAHTLDIDTARGLLYLQRDNNHTAHASQASAAQPGTRAAALPAAAFSDVVAKPEHPVGASDNGSIEIWDIKTDPENPQYVNTFNSGKNIHDMTVVGDLCYVAEGFANSFSVWNVKDPLKPTLTVRWQVAPGNFAHNIWPSGDGSFVVTTEEIPTGLPARVWQLNGTAAPTQLSSIKIGTGTPHNVIMEGRMAYLSHYSEGAAVVDLNNPSAPRVVAQLDTSSATGPALAGCWGVYKFPGKPLMVCSDMSNGFHLIRITGQ